MNMFETQTKFLLYCVILFLEFSFLSEVNGQVIDEHANSSEFSIVRDWKYNGNDLGPIINASSFTECEEQCYQNDNCKAFTWSTSLRSSSKNKCYLKSSIGQGGRQSKSHISGHRLGFMLRANNFKRRGNNLVVTDTAGREHAVSNRFGWSTHNCQHSGEKTGIVLYPTNTNYKNIVLLVCPKHYNYQPNWVPQTVQLFNWYYKLYGESNSFRLASGFSLRSDGTLGFNSWALNGAGLYANNNNRMSDIEMEVVRKVVNEQLSDYSLS